MNLKYFKQRASVSETPIKRNQQPIHLAQFFSRPGDQLANRNIINMDFASKENINPNIDIKNKKRSSKEKQNDSQITPKKKVIHLKSISRNSKSKKGNSGSLGKKHSMEHTFTEVADFTDNYSKDNRPSLVIQIDLLNKHRRSIQDTLVSTNNNNQQASNGEHLICTQHTNKKATFMVKGKPFCDKCSVKLITQGFVAVKIDNKQKNKNPQYLQAQPQIYNQDFLADLKKERAVRLDKFIEQLDKTQPNLQAIGAKLDEYVFWLSQYCTIQLEKLQQKWRNMLSFLQNYKQKLYTSFKSQQDKANRVLLQAQIKIKQQNQSLSFMRNDIIRNIDKIVDQSTVSQTKFIQVMNDFKTQLEQINQSAQQIKTNSLILPKVQFDELKLEQDIHRFLVIRSTCQAILIMSNSNSPADKTLNNYGDENPYRLSFGKEMERVQSPTFKVI